MSKEAKNSEQAVQAVFSVCASVDVHAAAEAACGELDGSAFVGEFSDYFSGERRPQLSHEVQEARSVVALIDCDRDAELALQSMERLRSMNIRNLQVAALGSEMDAAYLVRAMRAGCNEFLSKPVESQELYDCLLRFQNAHPPEVAAEQKNGRIITLFGSKGGVGTTTLAAHLANNLVRSHGKRTLLVDHHPELGHVALYLGIKGNQYHFDELVRNSYRLDADLLRGFVSRHPNGMDVLVSPDSCGFQHETSPDQMRTVLSFLRTQYDFVLIDSTFAYRGVIASMMENSDEVCLVSTPDVAALRDLARRIESLSLTSGSTEKLRVIINRSGSENAISLDQIQAAVTLPVWFSFANHHPEILRKLNGGELVPHLDRSAFAQQIRKWTDALVAWNVSTDPSAKAAKKRFALWPAKTQSVAQG
jgi:pilus assembly protein CpaE